MKTSQNEIVLTCYRNALKNANTPIGHNIAFLKNTLGIDIDNNEITRILAYQKYTLLLNKVCYCQIKNVTSC